MKRPPSGTFCYGRLYTGLLSARHGLALAFKVANLLSDEDSEKLHEIDRELGEIERRAWKAATK